MEARVTYSYSYDTADEEETVMNVCSNQLEKQDFFLIEMNICSKSICLKKPTHKQFC